MDFPSSLLPIRASVCRSAGGIWSLAKRPYCRTREGALNCFFVLHSSVRQTIDVSTSARKDWTLECMVRRIGTVDPYPFTFLSAEADDLQTAHRQCFFMAVSSIAKGACLLLKVVVIFKSHRKIIRWPDVDRNRLCSSRRTYLWVSSISIVWVARSVVKRHYPHFYYFVSVYRTQTHQEKFFNTINC